MENIQNAQSQNMVTTPSANFAVPPQQSNSLNKIPLVILVLISLILTGYFWFQNNQLKQQLNNQQLFPTPSVVSIIPTSTPTSIPTIQSNTNNQTPTASPTIIFDPIANWRTYTNKVFSIKLPETFDYDERFSQSPSNMYFSWADQKNTTPKIAIGIDLGFTQGDPKLMSCKTNEECWQGYQKSFAVTGFNTINADINGQSIKGFETTNGIYQNLYPISYDGKLFTIDIQIGAPTIEEAKLQIPQINQVLSTIKFTK